jgi:hypothetical protein
MVYSAPNPYITEALIFPPGGEYMPARPEMVRLPAKVGETKRSRSRAIKPANEFAVKFKREFILDLLKIFIYTSLLA